MSQVSDALQAGPQSAKGGCLCGAIQFTLNAPAEFPHYCSCSQCQRGSGAPVVAWVDFPRAALHYEQGQPQLFRSSAGTQRGFCARCGSTLFAFDDDSDWVSVTTACLEQPERWPPESHSFADMAPAWLSLKS